MFDRIISFIGEDQFKKIEKKTVCVIGLGGVGGYAVESLVRSGICHILLVDCDKIDITNLNRQLVTTRNNLNQKKTEAWKERILSISPSCEVMVLDLFLDKENIEILSDYSIDYVIDACDTISTKEALIKYCISHHVSIISCMGTGNKLDPSKLEVTEIRKTSYDPIAKKIRKFLRDEGIREKVPVVSSMEPSSSFQGEVPSFVFVPAVAGLLLANYVICDIIKD